MDILNTHCINVWNFQEHKYYYKSYIWYLLSSLPHRATGSHFCTAKELSEEIRALSSEQEGLESLLGRLLALSSRSIRRLGSVKEDYARCSQDLALQEAAHSE